MEKDPQGNSLAAYSTACPVREGSGNGAWSKWWDTRVRKGGQQGKKQTST